MSKQIIVSTIGNKTGSIDELIDLLQKAKEKGATHYAMTWSQDPMWAFKWFELYRIKSEEEMKEEQIAELEYKLKTLKESNGKF